MAPFPFCTVATPQECFLAYSWSELEDVNGTDRHGDGDATTQGLSLCDRKQDTPTNVEALKEVDGFRTDVELSVEVEKLRSNH